MEYKIKVHGEYPFDMGIQWHTVIRMSTNSAYELFCDCLREGEGIEENDLPSIVYFSKQFMNKGYKILTEIRDQYTALYLHDGNWSLITTDKQEYLKCCAKKYLIYPKDIVEFVRY